MPPAFSLSEEICNRANLKCKERFTSEVYFIAENAKGKTGLGSGKYKWRIVSKAVNMTR